MNLEFLENAMKARQYGEAAVKSLLPEDFRKHVDVIENEMTDMAIECLQKRRKRHSFYDGTSMNVTGRSENVAQKNVKKVTIE